MGFVGVVNDCLRAEGHHLLIMGFVLEGGVVEDIPCPLLIIFCLVGGFACRVAT